MTTDTMKLNEVEAMIRSWAKRLALTAGGSMDADDLAQVGRMAALKAAETFDPEGGKNFRGYCWHPVKTAMRRAAWESRSVTGKVTRCVSRDLSFSAPVSPNGESDEVTLGDTFESEEASVEDRVAKAQVEAKVRAIVAKVRAEQTNGGLFDDLLDRLMNSYFADSGVRMRSAVSYEDLAAKHGCSRQNINQRERKIRAALAAALEGVEG